MRVAVELQPQVCRVFLGVSDSKNDRVFGVAVILLKPSLLLRSVDH